MWIKLRKVKSLIRKKNSIPTKKFEIYFFFYFRRWGWKKLIFRSTILKSVVTPLNRNTEVFKEYATALEN
jgi:hypothetical protein